MTTARSARWRDRTAPLRLAAEAAVVSTALRLLVRLWGSRRVILATRAVRLGHRGRTGADGRAALVGAVDLAVRRVGGHRPFRHACLPRSLTTTFMLRRRGVDATHCFGVRRPADDVVAHAWVEVDGRPVGEPPGLVEAFRRVDVGAGAGAAGGDVRA